MLQHGCSVCQEALKTCREAATSLGLWLRPRLFQLAPVAADEEARPAVPGSDSSGSPGTEYSDYETLYLACSTAKKGVLQLHKAHAWEGWFFRHRRGLDLFVGTYMQCHGAQVFEDIQGYKVLFRAEELWSVSKRLQHFHNFFSKMSAAYNCQQTI